LLIFIILFGMDSNFYEKQFRQDLPQYHPPRADKSAGATGQAGLAGYF
jgi:hypothetical protein